MDRICFLGFWVVFVSMAACEEGNDKASVEKPGEDSSQRRGGSWNNDIPEEFTALIEFLGESEFSVLKGGKITQAARLKMESIKDDLEELSGDEIEKIQNNFAAYVFIWTLMSERLYQDLMKVKRGERLEANEIRRVFSKYRKAAEKFGYARSSLLMDVDAGSSLSMETEYFSVVYSSRDNLNFKKYIEKEIDSFRKNPGLTFQFGKKIYRYMFDGDILEKLPTIDIDDSIMPKDWQKRFGHYEP